MLPDEILVNILINTNPHELNNLCRSSSRIRNICYDNVLWYNKLILDYPEEVNPKPKNISWKDWYIYVYQNPMIPIYYRGDNVGSIRIHLNDPTTTFDELHRHFLNKAAYYTIWYYGDNEDPIYEYEYINPIPSLNRLTNAHISFNLRQHNLSPDHIKYIVLTIGRR